jgi:hypothetical protein
MDTVSKKHELSKVPTRKLLALVKREIRRQIQASAKSSKPKKMS